MNDALDALLTQHDITVTSVFVPWSKSRNNKEKDRSLNWVITITKAGRHVITTDYMAGIGHCPSYKQNPPKTYQEHRNYVERIEAETEQGYATKKPLGWQPAVVVDRKKPIVPSTANVIYCFTADASVLDAGGFEDWARDYGYDTDSRKAEKLYRDCLEIALKLRAGLGDELITQLREVADQ